MVKPAHGPLTAAGTLPLPSLQARALVPEPQGLQALPAKLTNRGLAADPQRLLGAGPL